MEEDNSREDREEGPTCRWRACRRRNERRWRSARGNCRCRKLLVEGNRERQPGDSIARPRLRDTNNRADWRSLPALHHYDNPLPLVLDSLFLAARSPHLHSTLNLSVMARSLRRSNNSRGSNSKPKRNSSSNNISNKRLRKL